MGAAMNAMALMLRALFVDYLSAASCCYSSEWCLRGKRSWAGIALALAVCFLTALSYSELAKIP